MHLQQSPFACATYKVMVLDVRYGPMVSGDKGESDIDAVIKPLTI